MDCPKCLKYNPTKLSCNKDCFTIFCICGSQYYTYLSISRRKSIYGHDPKCGDFVK